MDEGERATKLRTWWKAAVAIAAALFVLVFGKAIGAAIGTIVSDRMGSGYSEARQNDALKRGLDEAARAIREQAPIQVDESTTLVGALSSGREITYLYTLSFDIPPESLGEAEAELQEQNQQRVCSEERTRELISAGGAMSANYNDESGDILRTRVTSCPDNAA